ncbi:2Fe-2S iron-sulfur cluster binding domain-containing protein [Novosphingobium flavum]|uniref:2Fe-2S iron-sulfur cluster binding domain-containing protein n=1 Tax=Sphingomonadales TaxID=204457 RepID=UPI000E751825|nr:2Fe-2S iron-sulfur cluster binding domain-containing protein [Novosphingobium aerophilum]
MTNSPLPNALARSGQDGFLRIHIVELDATVQIGKAETVYSAIRGLFGQRQARGCLHGGCGLCLIGVLRGQVNQLGPMSRDKLQTVSLASKAKLACRIGAATDLEIELGPRLRRCGAPQT